MKKTYPTYEEAQRIVQEKGIHSKKSYDLVFKELGLPSNPNHTFKGKGWIDWATFLGKVSPYPTYQEAKMIIRDNGIQNREEYKASFKVLGLPADPCAFYKDRGWIDYYDFYGKDSPKEFPSYEETKKIIKERGIKTLLEYNKTCKKLGLPSNPRRYFKDKGWIDKDDFLGLSSTQYPSYEEAKSIVQEKGFTCAEDYMLNHKEIGLPCAPYSFYKDSGWVDWYDFLGKSKQTTQEDRKYNLFKKLAINPVLLKDAPLKVLYIYFSKFRGITDGITSLLATSSYEERLNWVKEQLNSLKDGSLSKDKSSEEPDELSAMKSVLEENDDVKESLSGEDAERFNILLENYVHSVVNRELISEVDDK